MKFVIMLCCLLQPLTSAAKSPQDEQSWWKKRQQRPDIFYPHDAHRDIMKQEGDSCLRCHPFSKNEQADKKRLREITVIANEPLEAICHSCHVDQHTAPSRCDLCHRDMSVIWPEDHDIDYKNRHAETARRDADDCARCHIDVSFCADCHFQRQTLQRNQHSPAYAGMHGLDARFDNRSCASCHNADYCANCHRTGVAR